MRGGNPVALRMARLFANWPRASVESTAAACSRA